MPLDFWTTAIAELKNVKPGIFMLAEDDGTQYNTAGFDMTYAWGLYGFGNGILPNIVAGTNTANLLNTFQLRKIRTTQHLITECILPPITMKTPGMVLCTNYLVMQQKTLRF